MKQTAKTVTEFLASLPEHRRKAMRAVRAVIKQSIPKGYVEGFGFGMIVWCVPLKLYPDTYNGQPFLYAALASQQNHMALYLMCSYMSPVLQKQLADGFKAAGKKLDMGKACIRFKQLEDLPLGVVADIAGAVPMKACVEAAQRVHAKRK